MFFVMDYIISEIFLTFAWNNENEDENENPQTTNEPTTYIP